MRNSRLFSCSYLFMREKHNYPVHPVHSGDATADSRTLLKQPREIIKVAHCITQIPLHSLALPRPLFFVRGFSFFSSPLPICF